MYLNLNGKIIRQDKACISPDNRSFRYGDGFFETLRIHQKEILLKDYHFERLFASLQQLRFEPPAFFTADYLASLMAALALKNNHVHARIRCNLFRGDGGVYDQVSHSPQYLIQSWDLNPANDLFNENGLSVDFFHDAVKTADQFSAVKSNNFLPYVMGALHAKKHRINDCILLNAFGKIADTTIANIFIFVNGTVKTPPLTDGPVAGVMRRYLIKCMHSEKIPVQEASLSTDDILQASEVFLTNAIYGIRWVKQVGGSNYTCALSSFLHSRFISPLFAV